MAMEVDAFLDGIRDTFLGVRKPPVRSNEVRDKQFSSTWNDDPTIAMTRTRLPRSSMPPASGWPQWSPRTGQQDHRSAVPFSPNGPSGPTQHDFQPPPPARVLRDGGGGRLPKRAAGHVSWDNATPSEGPEPARTEARYAPVVLDYPWLVAAWLRRAGG